MAKVTEYSRITKMKDNDVLLVDGPDGTRTILQTDASKQMGGEVIMVNETAGDSTKVVINTTDEEIELATMADLEPVEEDVDELKESVNKMQNLETDDITDNIGFVLGKAWSGAAGTIARLSSSYPYRVSNTTPIRLREGKYTILVNSDYRISYRVLDENNTIISDSGWKTGEISIDASGEEYYAFTGGKNADAELTIDEFLENEQFIKNSTIVRTVNDILEDIESKENIRDVLATIQLNGNYWVEVDTVAKTLTIPADTSIYCNDGTRYNFAESQTINLVSVPSSSSMKIIFNTEERTFSVLQYAAKIPDGCVPIAYYQGSGSASLTISCRYKINGNPYSIVEGTDARDVLATITPPQAAPYVDVARVADVTNITFFADTSIFHNSLSGKRYVLSEAQTVSISIHSSTLQKIIYNTKTGVISNVSYNANIPAGSILLATLRTIPPTLSITCPYRINGNLYDINTASHDEQITFSANVKAVNHRGFNSVAPENTLPAFKLSRQNGFRYVETDVRFTSDGVPVLLHDPTINRTARNSDGTEITETINIADITLEQARAYDFGIWKNAIYAGTQIPTLDEFMKLCRDIGLIPRVELDVLTVQNAETMFAVIDKYGMARKVEYNCNSISVCQKFLELEPHATIVHGMGSYVAGTVDNIGALKTDNNTIIINMQTDGVTEELIEKCKQYDIELEVWTVNSSATILALDPFISGVTSDSLNAAVILYNNAMS